MRIPGTSLCFLRVDVDFRHSCGMRTVDVVRKITQQEETGERDATSGCGGTFQLCGVVRCVWLCVMTCLWSLKAKISDGCHVIPWELVPCTVCRGDFSWGCACVSKSCGVQSKHTDHTTKQRFLQTHNALRAKK